MYVFFLCVCVFLVCVCVFFSFPVLKRRNACMGCLLVRCQSSLPGRRQVPVAYSLKAGHRRGNRGSAGCLQRGRGYGGRTSSLRQPLERAFGLRGPRPPPPARANTLALPRARVPWYFSGLRATAAVSHRHSTIGLCWFAFCSPTLTLCTWPLPAGGDASRNGPCFVRFGAVRRVGLVSESGCVSADVWCFRPLSKRFWRQWGWGWPWGGGSGHDVCR